MKLRFSRMRKEFGQVLPLVALMMVAIVGMVALIIDGGALMSNRRTAQAAADAGALAGAKVLCSGGTNWKTVAENYAAANQAPSPTVTMDAKEVTVNTTVSKPSFFAGIFGEDNLKTNASASAGCFAVAGKSVVPLAWNCQAPNVGDTAPFDPTLGCQAQELSWKDIGPVVDPNWKPPSEIKGSVEISDFEGIKREYKLDQKYTHSLVDSNRRPPEQIYIIMNNDKICIEDLPPGDPNLKNAITCDLDDDGKKDIQTGGDRGWLYLTKDTNNIAKWIKDNGPHPDFSMDSHKWLSGKPGGDEDIYKEMINANFPGQVVLIPVYNTICDGDPQVIADCVTVAHSPPWDPLPKGGDDFSQLKNGNKTNYHIVTFAPFYVACVDKQGDCPGYNYAQTLSGGNNLKKEPVIEGYFLKEVEVTPDITQDCTINMGNCTISLSK